MLFPQVSGNDAHPSSVFSVDIKRSLSFIGHEHVSFYGKGKMFVKTVSHYRILEKLGEGGMGVVCEAQDTKLERMVVFDSGPRGARGSAYAYRLCW